MREEKAKILPNGWALAELGKLALYANGRAFKPKEWQVHGKPIIRIQNLNLKFPVFFDRDFIGLQIGIGISKKSNNINKL